MKKTWKTLLVSALLLALLAPAAAHAADDYYIEDSDSRRLTKSELRDYSLDDLGFIRNEILARHGYPFKTKKFIDYFYEQDWYFPDDAFEYDWLSKLEMDNVETIKQVEAEKQDDDYDDSADDRGDYFIEDSDVRLLTKSELRGYSLEDLGFIRNEILARHGYPFKTKAYKDYFNAQWWYTRDDDFDFNWLSSTEMKNVELIKKIEKEKG